MRRILRFRAVAALIVGVLLAAAVVAPISASAIPAPNQAIYRFYNQGTGAHFYTNSVAERDHVIATWPMLFTYEGVAFYVYDESMFLEEASASGVSLLPTSPVYRFFNKLNGSHFYTLSAEEADMVIAKFPGTFSYDGVGFSAYSAPVEYMPLMPVYRFYNTENGSHFYTISPDEKALVLLYYGGKYRFEGVAFYAMSGYLGGD
ncbi:MAG: hypothetical protein Q7W51_05720 [Coriobacteriia bacterium]|nr:hypothetical protein [Coriobacteriia bacterium]